MLQINKLLKKYNNTTILDIENIQLSQGVYWLKGANGAGKSTLLKCIATQIPYEGNVLISDISFQQAPVAYRNLLSYHAAEGRLPVFATGMECVNFVANIRNSMAQVPAIIEQFVLADYVANSINSYSTGMLKRLSLALAFIGSPKLIMLDEPLSTLDVSMNALVCDIINTYAQQGSAFIITSHQDFEYAQLNFNKTITVANTKLTIA